MLNGITWGQFSIFLLIVTGGYYLYVVVGYYRAEVVGWLTRRGRKKKGAVGQRVDKDGPTGGDGDNAGLSREREAEAMANQPELFGKEGAVGGGDGQFQLMQRAIGVIRQVIAQGIESKLDRENLLDHIREVLGDCRQLRKTEYAETINNFLIRVCSAELSLELGEKELAGLWK